MNQRIADQTSQNAPTTPAKGLSSKSRYLLFLLPALCCGLPLMATTMVALVATASALTDGVIVGVVVGVVGVVVIAVVRRRSRVSAACRGLVHDMTPSDSSKAENYQ